MRLLSLACCVAVLPYVVHSACECGYVTSAKELFQYAVITNFAQTSNQAFQESPNWKITQVVYGESISRPIATNYTPANVAVTNGQLHLTCSAYNTEISNSIRSAQIESTRSDILHGSFRARFSVTGVAQGVIGALFFYADDTEEIDIEILTRDNPNTMQLTNQPDDSSQAIMPRGLKRYTFNDYRIDWTSASTAFYINNVLLDTKTDDVPTINGSVYMNSWGGSTYAGTTPPSSDVVVAVSDIELYFNTSDAELSKSWTSACQQAKVPACHVN